MILEAAVVTLSEVVTLAVERVRRKGSPRSRRRGRWWGALRRGTEMTGR